MNKKTLFLVITLIAMLILVTSVNAATDSTNISTAHSISEKTTTAEPVVKEKIEKTQTKELKTDKTQTKQITKTNKTEKQTKKDSITINGKTYTEIVENEEVELDEIWDRNKDKIYFFNNCTFINEYMEVYNDIYINNSIINCQIYFESEECIINNSDLNCIDGLMGESSLIIENSVINGIVDVYGNKEVRNSTINQKFYADPETYIYDVILGKNGQFIGNVIGEPLDPSIKIDVNNLEELTNTMNIATNDIENEYIINLNEGTYTGTTQTWNEGDSSQKITINGNNQTINIDNQLNINSKNTIIIKNTTINTIINNYNPDLTIQDSTLQKEINNNNNLKIIGTLNSTINNEGTLIIDENTIIGENYEINGNGKIYTNATQTINGNQTITNKNFKLGVTIPTTGNITLTNCQINAKITNNGNITLQNCSLSNNNMTTTGSKTDGFLLENKGNATLIDCRVENNTFNLTNYQSGREYNLYGAIVNSGVLNIVKTTFHNNKVNATSALGACVYNNGVLNILNSTFDSNQASVRGGAIFSDSYSKLTIDNSQFNNNFAGMYGGAIYINDRTGILSADDTLGYNITNSNFTKNSIDNNRDGSNIGGGIKPSGGALYIGIENGIIDNCEFRNNNVGTQYGQLSYNSFYGGAISLSAGSHNINHTKFINNTAEAAATIYISRYKLDFYSNTIIDNCIFENNYVESVQGSASSIIVNRGNLNILNSEFKNNSKASNLISTLTEVESKTEKSFANNKFINNSMTSNTIYSEYQNNWTASNNKYINTTLNDNIELNLPDYIFTGQPLTITGTYTINNPKDYDADITEQTQYRIYLNGRLYQTLDKIEFTITPTNNNMIITVEPTISQTRKAFSIRPLNDITITPENYDEYIYAGTLLGVNRDSKVTFQGTFTDKGEIFIDTPDIIIDGSNATFTNTRFTLEASGITIQNMKINNTQTQYPIQNTKDNNKIINNTIKINNTDGKTAAILNKASNTTISYNTLIVDGPAYTIDHNNGLGIAETQAILLIGGDKNKVEHNNIEVTSSGTSSIYGTIEAITNHDQATNTLIQYNNITVGGNAKFNYGIDTLGNVQNITIQYNNVQVTGERYTAGIQTGDGAQNIEIRYNNVTCNCHNNTPVDEEAVAYGIITLNIVGYDTPNQIYIDYNNINIDSAVGYGIELYKTNNTQIHDNNINVKGLQSMGIGCAYSTNSYISNNNIKTSGDSSITLRQVTEEIQPANVGIQIQQESDNANINYNTIQTYDTQTQDTCIYIRSNNAIVGNNKLTSTTKVGNQAVNGQQDTSIFENTAIEQNSTTETTTETLTIGDSTTITAQFYDDTYTPIGDGKAIFRVNGKTLRDNQGNVIYADVINGRAELPDVNITQEWMKPDTTIQAVYVGDDNNDPITTKPTTVTVTKPEAQITLEAPTEATAGQEITLKATVTDGENNITSGRVAFKLNGKTLKDPKTGKALYAEVKDGVATITYTIPEKTKAKEYTLTIVFTDTNYDRVEAESKLNVVKA
jgi:predicted outer membrane repeat protein